MKYLFILLFCFGCMTPKKVSEIVKAEIAKTELANLQKAIGWGGITHPIYKWGGITVDTILNGWDSVNLTHPVWKLGGGVNMRGDSVYTRNLVLIKTANDSIIAKK